MDPVMNIVAPVATEAVRVVCGRTMEKTNQELDYVKNKEFNRRDLEDKSRELQSTRAKLQREVNRGRKLLLEPSMDYDNWIKEADKISASIQLLIEASDKLTGTGGNECLQLLYLRSNYSYGKQLANKISEVKSLLEKVNQMDLLQKPLPPKARKISVSYERIQRFEAVLSKLLEFHRDNHSKVAGLWGSAGVGKSTILMEFNNRVFEDRDMYDFILFVPLENNTIDNGHEEHDHPIMMKVHEAIRERLDITWTDNDGSPEKRAEHLLDVLTHMSFLIILDGLTRPIELARLGIPLSNKGNRVTLEQDECLQKVVISSFNKHLLREWRMLNEGDMKIELECLSYPESMDLFLSKIPDLPKHLIKCATDVVKLCSGMPQNILCMANYLKEKTRQPDQWRAVRDRVQSQSFQFISSKNDAFHRTMRLIFNCMGPRKAYYLFCALFPLNRPIDKYQVISFSHRYGLFAAVESLDDIYVQGLTEIDTLVTSDGLLEWADEDHLYIKMNYMNRYAAMWLTEHELKEKWLVKTDAQLKVAPQSKSWEGCKGVSLMYNDIIELVPPRHPTTGQGSCPDLAFLSLRGNPNLARIAPDFFNDMLTMRVLDLSGTGIRDVPEGIQVLSNLQYLNLSFTNITALPRDIMCNLVRLRHLGLESTPLLEDIPDADVMELLPIQLIILWDSNLCKRNDLFQLLEKLKHLDGLHMDVFGHGALVSFLQQSDRLRSVLRRLRIKDYCEPTLDMKWLLQRANKVMYVAIEQCESLELKIGGQPTSESKLLVLTLSNISQLQVNFCMRSPIEVLSSVCSLTINNCGKLVDITWSVKLPTLRKLSINNCNDLECVVAGQVDVTDVGLFASLEKMELTSLPKLQSISTTSIEFPSLKSLKVKECPNFRRLSIKMGHSLEYLTEIKGEEDWWEKIRWETVGQKLELEKRFKAWTLEDGNKED